MSDTQIRVPLMHGFPKQMFGSIEIRARSELINPAYFNSSAARFTTAGGLW
jgi:hypothetical protein